LRKLLVVGAHAVLFHRKLHTDPLRMWAKKLIDNKPFMDLPGICGERFRFYATRPSN